MYGKIFVSMLDSSVMEEDIPTRFLWTCLIVLANEDGVVDMTDSAIARRCNLPLDAVRTGLGKLSAPDPGSRSDAREGRRIVPLDTQPYGWELVNHAKYREFRSESARREYYRNYRRQRRATGKDLPTPPEGEGEPSARAENVHSEHVNSAAQAKNGGKTRTASTRKPKKKAARKPQKKKDLPDVHVNKVNKVERGVNTVSVSVSGGVGVEVPTSTSTTTPPCIPPVGSEPSDAAKKKRGRPAPNVDPELERQIPTIRDLWKERMAGGMSRKITPSAEQKQLDKLARVCSEHGPEPVLAAIEETTCNSYQGIFPEKHLAAARRPNGRNGYRPRHDHVAEFEALAARGTAEPLDITARLAALAEALPRALPGRKATADRIRAATADDSELVEATLAALDLELLEAAQQRLDDNARAEVDEAIAKTIAGVNTGAFQETDEVRQRLRRQILRRRERLPVLSLFSPEAEPAPRESGGGA